MRLKLGFSTCPNDTFVFDAMVHHKIDTEGLAFEVTLADVEQLNKLAFATELDISKLSYHAFAYLSKQYALLDSGSALGHNNGPLIISKRKIYPDELKYVKIAIPGKYTTANLLLSIAYPDAQNKQEYLFSDIEEAVLSNETEAGVIIHENRFTYEAKGLKKIIDLGEWWEQFARAPIPLGGIVVNRNLSFEIQQKINRIMRRSVEYAFKNPDSSIEYVKRYAQEMSTDVMYKHINLYVNEYTKELGILGKKAISVLFQKAQELQVIPEQPKSLYIE